MVNGYKNIIWDWNGTLLNDLHICIESINPLLQQRELPLLTPERYREVFGFPVKEYYARIGFDFSKEPFDIPAREFILGYYSRVDECVLHNNVTDILNHLKKSGIRQFVLSAMEHGSLVETLTHHGIFSFFDDVAGLDNHHAASKTNNGILLMQKHKLIPAETCLIGDTIHDFEVAGALNCNCLLFAGGHQSKQRLATTGGQIIDELSELLPS